jgi:phosphohistidine phosphatase
LVSLSQCSEIILYFYTNSKLKTVFIIRHAKSDQSFFGTDFERPLNDRGKTDAPEMAKRLLDKKIKIDALVASPAARAKKTAELFATALQVPVAEIISFRLFTMPGQMFF